jgi:GxxExxY protein
MDDVNNISGAIVNAAMKVHTVLGPGLLESTYEACLAYELRARGHLVGTQCPLPVVYEGLRLDAGYRIDMLVDDAVVVELKSCDEVAPVCKSQLLTYLRLSGKRVGLLINFNVTHLKDGIDRVSNHAPNIT